MFSYYLNYAFYAISVLDTEETLMSQILFEWLNLMLAYFQKSIKAVFTEQAVLN